MQFSVNGESWYVSKLNGRNSNKFVVREKASLQHIFAEIHLFFRQQIQKTLLELLLLCVFANK